MRDVEDAVPYDANAKSGLKCWDFKRGDAPFADIPEGDEGALGWASAIGQGKTNEIFIEYKKGRNMHVSAL